MSHRHRPLELEGVASRWAEGAGRHADHRRHHHQRMWSRHQSRMVHHHQNKGVRRSPCRCHHRSRMSRNRRHQNYAQDDRCCAQKTTPGL